MSVGARRVLPALLLLAGTISSPFAAGDKPSIDELSVDRVDGRLLVSYRVANGLSPETLERLRSGIAVRFRHRVELVARRWFPLTARVLARTVVETTAEYDSLTKRYALSLTIAPRHARRDDAPTSRSAQTSSVDELRAWMTELRDVPLEPENIPDSDRLRVRAESTLGRRFVLWIFPSRIDASDETRLGP